MTDQTPRTEAGRCDWRVNQRCQHELGHGGKHMVMPLKPFDYMDPYGKPYDPLAQARTEGLDALTSLVDDFDTLDRSVIRKRLRAILAGETE
jgi:hypothetical protein